MIELVRGPEPEVLRGPRAQAARVAVSEYLAQPESYRRQHRFQVRSEVYGHQDVVAQLQQMSSQKCAYCESYVGRLEFDHFRPKAGALDFEGRFSPDHYLWLAYEWDNLFLVCTSCNRYKAGKFPVYRERAAVGAMREQLAAEEPVLLCPTVDRIPSHLAADTKTGLIRPLSDRGAATVELLQLNRELLVDARRNQLNAVRAHHHTAKSHLAAGKQPQLGWLSEILRGASQFSMFGRAYAEEHAAEFARIIAGSGSSVLALELESLRRAEPDVAVRRKRVEASRTVKAARTRYIENVLIENFRGIESLEMATSSSTELAPWAMIIGENGVGKSSVLHAIALALSHAVGRPARLSPSDVARRGATSGRIALTITGEQAPAELSYDVGGRFRYSGPRLDIPVAGYGATRMPPRRGGGSSRKGRTHIKNLFDGYEPLIAPAPWLQSRTKAAFDYAVAALRKVLTLRDDDDIVREGDGVYVTMHGTTLDFDDLSDGYRSMAALVTDLIAYLQRDPERGLESVEGVVLLDEIGANLHPRWKMRVVVALRNALPRVQVFATTHDPLCLRGTYDAEVQVMRRIGGRVVLRDDLPSVEGLRVDQLLMSEYFGLSSTIDPAVEADFARYYELLANDRRTPEEDEETQRLAARLEPISLPGLSRRERLVLQFVDEFLAREEREFDPAVVDELGETARRQIRAALADALAEDDA